MPKSPTEDTSVVIELQRIQIGKGWDSSFEACDSESDFMGDAA